LRRPLIILLALALAGVLVAGAGLLLARRGGGPTLASGDRLLTLELDGRLDDYAAEVPFRLPGEQPEVTLAAIWRGLSAARADDDVRGVAVRIGDLDCGLAKAEELRRQFAETVAAGKFVACYLDTAGEGANGTLEYFVASSCSTVSLAPAGELNLLGLWSDGLFLRGTLDKLGVEPSYLTAGKYKSAAEVYTEHGHSAPAREALDAVLDGYFRQLVDGVAAARHLEPDAVRALVDRAPLSAEEALAAHLVDQLEYPDQFEKRLGDLAGEEDPPRASLADYAARHGETSGFGRRVVVLFVAGTIVRGGGGIDAWSGASYIGSRTLSEELRRLTEDDGVAAVVLRIDSPGGSALASDLILRRVQLLAERKPVVVSMSDLAASGGYYIAARASRIVAEAGTLTGSIGVVTGKLATARFQQDKLGITHDVLARGAHAGIYSPLAPFDDAQRELVAARVDDVYRRFLAAVAAGRSLPVERVRALAQGRVWTGEDASTRGLVDELGGFEAALAAARSAAGLPAGSGAVELRPRPRTFFDWLAGARPGPFSSELVRLAQALAAARAPLELELPPEVARLARPF
jgi:protease-4